jgi:DNA-binding MarR family transcriptional regulator
MSEDRHSRLPTILAYVAKNPGTTSVEVAKATGIMGMTSILAKATKRGHLTVGGTRGERKYYLKGQPELPLANGHAPAAKAPAREPAQPAPRATRAEQVMGLLRASDAGLTVAELAEKLGISRPHVNTVTAILIRRGRITSKKLPGVNAAIYRISNGEPSVDIADAADAEPRVKRKYTRRNKREMLLATMTMKEFERFCEAAEMQLEQGLALAYRLILKQFTSQFRGE